MRHSDWIEWTQTAEADMFQSCAELACQTEKHTCRWFQKIAPATRKNHFLRVCQTHQHHSNFAWDLPTSHPEWLGIFHSPFDWPYPGNLWATSAWERQRNESAAPVRRAWHAYLTKKDMNLSCQLPAFANVPSSDCNPCSPQVTMCLGPWVVMCHLFHQRLHSQCLFCSSCSAWIAKHSSEHHATWGHTSNIALQKHG